MYRKARTGSERRRSRRLKSGLRLKRVLVGGRDGKEGDGGVEGEW